GFPEPEALREVRGRQVPQPHAGVENTAIVPVRIDVGPGAYGTGIAGVGFGQLAAAGVQLRELKLRDGGLQPLETAARFLGPGVGLAPGLVLVTAGLVRLAPLPDDAGGPYGPNQEQRRQQRCHRRVAPAPAAEALDRRGPPGLDGAAFQEAAQVLRQ